MLTSSHMNNVKTTGASGFTDYRNIKHSLLVIILMYIKYSFLLLNQRQRVLWLVVSLEKWVCVVM